jgi:uncharacterized protein YcbX
MLTTEGVVENRRFYLAQADGTRLRSSRTAWPCRVRGEYDAGAERLRVRFPGGAEVEGSTVELGQTIVSRFSDGRRIEAQVVDGPWTEPLSELAGKPVVIARPPRPGMCFEAPVTLMSKASLDRLAEQAGDAVDGRRFRMLFTLAGCGEHAEDTWRGRLLRIADVLLRVGGPVDRCAVTTRDPDTGERDLDTLRLLKDYRGLRDGKHVDFGVYATVERPGHVRVGDAVELV